MKSSHHLAITTLLAAGTLACIQNNPDRPIAYQLGSTFSKADSIRCDRSGGGQITFSLQRSQDPKILNLSVTKYRYSDTNIAFSMTQADLDEATWTILQELFDGSTDLGGTIYADPAPTGTWFYGYSLLNGVSLRIANPQTLSRLSSLQTKVEGHLPLS